LGMGGFISHRLASFVLFQCITNKVKNGNITNIPFLKVYIGINIKKRDVYTKVFSDLK